MRYRQVSREWSFHDNSMQSARRLSDIYFKYVVIGTRIYKHLDHNGLYKVGK